MARSKSPAAKSRKSASGGNPLAGIPFIGAHMPNLDVDGLVALGAAAAVGFAASKGNNQVGTYLPKDVDWNANTPFPEATKACGLNLLVVLYTIGCAQANKGGHWVTSAASTYVSAWGGMMAVNLLLGNGIITVLDTDKVVIATLVGWLLVNASKIHNALSAVEDALDNEFVGHLITIVNCCMRVHLIHLGGTAAKEAHAGAILQTICAVAAAHGELFIPANSGVPGKPNARTYQTMYAVVLVGTLTGDYDKGALLGKVTTLAAWVISPIATHTNLKASKDVCMTVYFIVDAFKHMIPK